MKKALILLLVFAASFAKSQVNSFISLKSFSYNGTTDTVDNAPILIDVNNNVVVSGNKKINSTQYDATTAQQLTNGILTWTTAYNLASNKAWVTANTSDASGNVFVTGGVATGTANGVDMFIAKYDNVGTLLWSNTYNGPNSTMDVGTCLCLDGSGNVYIGIASDGTLTALIDAAVVKFNGSTGVQGWEWRYNYANSIDVPTAISLTGNGAGVVVSGSSGSSYTNWDYFAATIRISDGVNPRPVVRTTGPGNAQDKVFGMATDTLGNTYITGSSHNGSNFDIKTTKIDTGMTVVWEQYWDGYSLNDGGINIALDDSLNVIVTGLSYYQDSTLSNLVVLKYDNGGNLKWNMQKRPGGGGTSAEGIRVKVKNNNEIFVGGNWLSNSNQDLVIMRFDSLGNQTLNKTYNGATNSTDKFMDFTLHPDSNYIYVSARTYSTGSLDANIVLTYKYDDFPMSIVTYSGNPARTENELLVSFQKTAVTASVINNPSIEHGMLSEFLTPTAMSALNSQFTSPVSNYPCYKVFPWMTMDDSVATDRAGNTIKIKHHWTTLGVILPNGAQDTVLMGYFNNAYSVVEYATFNRFAVPTFTVNDPQYVNGESSALVSTSLIPNANINIGPAWDIFTGSSDVVAGVFGCGINQMHPDFAWGGVSGAKVTNGWDYSVGGAGVPLVVGTSNDPRGHETACAGIITAANNNSFASPSVAGGMLGVGNGGMRLHDMKTAWTNTSSCWSLNPASQMASAIVQGALGTDHGFWHQVQNHSWTYKNYVMWNIFDALITSFESKVFMSLASGNDDDINNQCIYFSYPRLYPDRWMTCTGANDNTGYKASFSECGTNLDIIAPGVKDMYQPLCHDGSCTTIDTMKYGTSCAYPTDGTSFAAPHTTGVGGLMIGYIKNTLSMPYWLQPEDVEEILQLSATTVTVAPPNNTVPNALAGYGRLNAGNAMQYIKYPDYLIEHYATTASATTAVLEFSNHVTCLWNNLYGLPSGTVNVDRYKITKVVSHSIPSGYTFISGWERDAASNRIYGVLSGTSCANCTNSLMLTNYLPDYSMPNASDISATVTASSATLVGYLYGIHTPSAPSQIVWYPPSGLIGNANLEYSVYMKQTVGVEENAISERAISVYPNPANDKVYFSSNLNDLTKVKVTVYNVVGQQVMNETQLNISQPEYIDVSSLKNGLYLFDLTNGGKKIVKKIIINR
jgi:hypothetical protein